MKLIGICGPSNSGKSSICESLTKKYNAIHIEVDHYLKDKKDIPFERGYRNWELPQNHRFDDLLKDLKKLYIGKKINHPIYGFKKGEIKGYRGIKPRGIVFVEGFYLFIDKRIRDMFNLKIYLDISKQELFKRRVCTEEEYEWTKKDYLEKIVVPSYKKYGALQKKYADFVIDASFSFQEVKQKIINIIGSNNFSSLKL